MTAFTLGSLRYVSVCLFGSKWTIMGSFSAFRHLKRAAFIQAPLFYVALETNNRRRHGNVGTREKDTASLPPRCIQVAH